MTHTKGPWSYHKFQSGFTIFGDGEYPQALPVAKIAGDGIVGIADARLIAAAPVLYAALQEAYEALKDIVNASDNGQAYTDDELKTVFSPICDLTYTALAQADGKEQP